MSTTAESYLVGLIGDGTTRSLTPALHEEEARHHGIDYLYRPIDLGVIARPPEDVGHLLRAGRDLGFNAFNITHPCKQVAIPHLDELSPEAAALGAVNTVLIRDRRLVGHNTDYSGFTAAMQDGLPDITADRVVQLGAGGAGSAVAAALLALGAKSLGVYDLDAARSGELARSLEAAFPRHEVVALRPDSLPDALASADGIVNTTPVGMNLHPGTPIDTRLIRPSQWVAEIIYVPLETELVEAARAKGCRVLDGGHMAVGQAVDAFRLITGLDPDRTRMRSHFLALTKGTQG
ncbi:shikimate dehydrogenase [Sinomonas gamaensis]|uniref:shikimate dehydrogenase n=1 Tax=Sinomonas gamaensis TaxID=2565624 RepID=UPI001107BA64|nr:shikimate dehydrogenase [Sinomonas gamaensis]